MSGAGVVGSPCPAPDTKPDSDSDLRQFRWPVHGPPQRSAAVEAPNRLWRLAGASGRRAMVRDAAANDPSSGLEMDGAVRLMGQIRT